MWVITCFFTKDRWGKLWRFKNDLLSCTIKEMSEAFTGAFKNSAKFNLVMKIFIHRIFYIGNELMLVKTLNEYFIKKQRI